MDKPKTITPEAARIPRLVRAWLNSYPDKPLNMVDVEFLGTDSGLALSTIQAAYKTREYILDGYEAQYQFSIVYRTIPTTANERLEADEFLNEIGTWAEANPIELTEPLQTVKVSRNTNAALMFVYEGGVEDHQINMTLTYEVNV